MGRVVVVRGAEVEVIGGLFRFARICLFMFIVGCFFYVFLVFRVGIFGKNSNLKFRILEL